MGWTSEPGGNEKTEDRRRSFGRGVRLPAPMARCARQTVSWEWQACFSSVVRRQREGSATGEWCDAVLRRLMFPCRGKGRSNVQIGDRHQRGHGPTANNRNQAVVLSKTEPLLEESLLYGRAKVRLLAPRRRKWWGIPARNAPLAPLPHAGKVAYIGAPDALAMMQTARASWQP